MNIVFDLGGVVFEWLPDKIIDNIFNEQTTKELVKKQAFQHPDWLELDRGTLSVELAIQRGVERTHLNHNEISQILNSVPLSLIPIKETIELLHYLKNTFNKLYVLSNMHKASMDYLEKNHSFWNIFEGIVFSCEVHKIKPEPEIYEHLLNKFRLEAGKTVFIDDMQENLDAATKFDIKTIHF